MTKKKRDRRDQKHDAEDFLESLEMAIESADDYIRSASPLQISTRLVAMGVTTAHRSGIEDYLKNWTPTAEYPEQDQAFEALAEFWLSEIEKKRGEDSLSFDEDVLLVEIARLFWGRVVGTSAKNE